MRQQPKKLLRIVTVYGEVGKGVACFREGSSYDNRLIGCEFPDCSQKRGSVFHHGSVDEDNVDIRKSLQQNQAILRRVRGDDIVLGSLDYEFARRKSLWLFRFNHQDHKTGQCNSPRERLRPADNFDARKCPDGCRRLE